MDYRKRKKWKVCGKSLTENLALIPTGTNRVGFVPNLSMRGEDKSTDNEETLSARLQPSKDCTLATDTPPPLPWSCGSRHRPLGHSSCKQSRTSKNKYWTSTEITRWEWKFQSQTQSQTMWGSEDSKTGGWTSTRAYKQVAKAKLDLNKTQVFSTADKEYMKGGGRPQGSKGRAQTLGRIPNGPNLIHNPLGQNTVAQHPGQKDLWSIICRLRTPQDRYENESGSIWKLTSTRFQEVLVRSNPTLYATVASVRSWCCAAVRIQPTRNLFRVALLHDS
jgi:hypothetical protein